MSDSTVSSLSNQHKLMFATLKHNPPDDEIGHLASLLSDEQWCEFASLVIDQHRVGPLVWSALDKSRLQNIPSRIGERLKSHSHRAAIDSLRLKAETLKIVGTLNKSGIVPAILKGWPLEEDLFRSAGKRVMRDVDLLVADNEIAKTAEILLSIGYRSDIEMIFRSQAKIDFAGNFTKDYILYSVDRQSIVELHTRPVRLRHLLPTKALSFQTKSVLFQEREVAFRILSDPSCYLYLAIHGQMHRWQRVKWLCDFPPLMQRMTETDWREIIHLSRIYGVQRTACSALVACGRLFGVRIPEQAAPLLAAVDEEKIAATICRDIANARPASGMPTLKQSFEILANDYGLSDRWRPKASAVLRHLHLPAEIAKTRLPDRLLFLLYFTLPFRLTARLLSRLPLLRKSRL